MLNKRKDEKIQIYRKKSYVPDGSTREINERRFIYDYDTFMGGGLWANARALTNTEIVSGALTFDKINVKFTINRNDKLATDLKVIYRNKVYDIQTIDPLDFRNPECSFTAVQTVDNVKYDGGDLFE